MAAVTQPTTFRLCGLTWDLLPDVFSPAHCLSTRLFADWIPYSGRGSFLEIGCGSGVIAVIAALRGCSRVTAVDVSMEAVENTRRNVIRHGVADRVRPIHSDLFDALGPHDRFDAIFWNSCFVDVPPDRVLHHDIERAVFDPGYRTHARFVAQAPDRLARNGRLLLGFSDLGNHPWLRGQAAERGLDVRILRTSGRRVPDVEFQLLELTANASGEGARCLPQ